MFSTCSVYEIFDTRLLSLVNGMNFLVGIEYSGSVVLEGTRDIIVPRHASVSQNISITARRPLSNGGNGGSGLCTIVMLSPVLIKMKVPVSVTLQGVQIKNVSPKGFSTYFSVSPDTVKLLKANTRSGGGCAGLQGVVTRSMATSVVLSSMDGVVQCNNCRFTTDLGLCNSTSGACIVEDATKSVFRQCLFETIVPAKLMNDPALFVDVVKGPKVCVAASPSWGRAVFSLCQGAEEGSVWGGCSLV